MADEVNKDGKSAGAAGTARDIVVDLDSPSEDLDAAMRAAVAAVEEIEAGARHDKDDRGAGSAEELTRLRREIADLRDRSVRTLADFDNFRKRAEREKEEVRKYALAEPLRDFLGVADNLERALAADGPAEDLKRGVEMILRMLQDLLRRMGLRETGTAGEPFDPAVHEAVARVERPDVKVPTVAQVMLRGYFIHDRLLRPAMVQVAVPVEKGPAEPAASPVGGDGPPV